MAALAPFTAHIKITPSRGQATNQPSTGAVVVRRGGKWDHYRDLQKLAVDVYEALEDAGTVTLPEPGGGQNRIRTTQFSAYGGLVHGTAVTPQFGNKPALLMIEGFRSVSSNESDQPAADTHLIHAGDRMTGPKGQQPWLGTSGLPNATVESEVSALKTAIESAISAVTDDSGVVLSVFRLEYKGITWGDRGHTFP